MRALAPLLAVLSFVAGCQQSPEASEPQAAEDPCSGPKSNLEYTECWQDLARGSRSGADATYARALQATNTSDGRAGVAAPDDAEYSTWLSGPLQESQADWIRYSDRQCLLEGRIARGGTGTRALVAKCQHRLSRQRVEELEKAIGPIEDSL